MCLKLPTSALEFMGWSWPQIEPHFDALAARPLFADELTAWLADWTHLSLLLQEMYWRLYVGTTVDTTDETAQQKFHTFLDEIHPHAQAAEQVLKKKLLDSGLSAPGLDIPLRNIRAEIDLFCDANLPLLSQELKDWIEYDQIIGAQTVEWEGQETTLLQLTPISQDVSRERRELAWRLATQRQLADRQRINDLWRRLMDTRQQLAANAGMPDYRSYRWKQLLRFDYTPADCMRFHRAIEQVVVPVVERRLELRRRRLGLPSLRPWDLDVDPFKREPLQPFQEAGDLVSKTADIFHIIDPQLGRYFDVMCSEGLLDVENRKSKAPGGYCTDFNIAGRPFIFMNAVGIHDDIITLLHEGGHAFHTFEMTRLPYAQQRQLGNEFHEVASVSMELIGSAYISRNGKGFYRPSDAARARVEHLVAMLRFWPYMAVVDAFQHWVYENHALASVPANCDAAWTDLWQRFMTGVDWCGLDDVVATGWQRKAHIPQTPFYYIEYGLAQLGAIQIWQKYQHDPEKAIANYRRALALGGTLPLPELYEVAGAHLAFDEETLSEAVELLVNTIAELEI